MIFSMHVVVSLQNNMKNSQKLIQNNLMTHQQKMFTNWQKLVRASEAGEKQADKEQQEIDITQSDKLRTQPFTFVLLKNLIHH